MSGDVWLGPVESGGTPVGRRRGACGSGPFPAAPGPNRTGAFQRIRLSSGCHVQFAAGFRVPRARRISVAGSALCITHTSWQPVILERLAPFVLRAAFPPSLAGRYSRDYYGPLSPWDSRPVGDPAFVPVIRASATQAPVHLLGCPRWASPQHWRCARTQRHARAVPGTGFVRLSGGGKVYPGWRSGFRQSSFSHIARVPSARRPYASARPLVS